jgi:two-component sensor histidine kinase
LQHRAKQLLGKKRRAREAREEMLAASAARIKALADAQRKRYAWQQKRSVSGKWLDYDVCA